MGRALGINAVQNAAFETAYGTIPGAGFKKLPFVSNALGEERPLIEDDQLGFGREGLDPTYDVATNDGDIVVPVDTRAIGFWLKLLLGTPTTTGTGTDPRVHTFVSGAAALPSASIEIGNPEVPSYSTNYGALANQLRIQMARSGMLNATLGMIAQGETKADTTSDTGTPTALTGPRFQQATGSVKRGGVELGSVVGADFTFSNNYEKVETIRGDGRIEGADPMKAMMTGSLTLKFASLALYNIAFDGTPIDLSFGWVNGPASLLFSVPRVFLPRTKRPISGPGGIQSQVNWQASGAGGHVLTVALTNDVTGY